MFNLKIFERFWITWNFILKSIFRRRKRKIFQIVILKHPKFSHIFPINPIGNIWEDLGIYLTQVFILKLIFYQLVYYDSYMS